MSFVDPGDPPEGGGLMKAKDLINKVCLFRPTGLGEWPPKEDKKAQPYVECDVWVLDRAGIVEEGQGVRVGWWKAVDQLRDQMGSFVGAKPEQEEGSNAIYLRRLEGAARDVAAEVAQQIGDKPAEDYSEETF